MDMEKMISQIPPRQQKGPTQTTRMEPLPRASDLASSRNSKSGAKGTRTPDPRPANNRPGVHLRPFPQVTVLARSPRYSSVRTGCGTSVLYPSAWSQQPPQFLNRRADVRQDPAQRAFGDVPAGVHRHCGAAAIGMAHDVMAARHPRDLEPGSF